ncbi:uroporphyrinogen-III C-methyltransferase [Photobacterium aphoticum]|uniref:Uroporphyrin-III methyltransferase n=1 Tax=Photobacterium aphoticum TaxID=754436 RepID=A0A0J1GNP8_9GAMM|nr:uroporphyrinogen-III C-methyltransferase [Photobacterium aphoticum]KLV01360.1 uroporphyrin-III methyltransferase [Photobacterium aphoticum]PSU53388.1 heme biosynthesis operon protein HemX [Photobacterium aphoticum]GHA61229.1 heme biosynthesis operon protein HemX [Photobacterium aphoticum]
MTDKKTNKDNAANNAPNAAQAASAPAANKGKTDKPASSTPSAAPQQPQTPPAQAEQKGSKTGLVAIALVIALGGGLYYHGHQQSLAQNAQMAAMQNEISSLQSSLQAAVKTSQQETLKQVNGALQEAEVAQTQQDKSITSLQMALAEVKGRRPNDWLLAEADYLVKMAGRKLNLEHDTVSAIVLLESADHRIAELNDPSLTPLRRAMRSDITTLKGIPRIDRDVIVLSLDSLQEKIPTLPLANAIIPDAQAVEKAEVSTSVDDWKTNLMTSLKSFSEHFVTYRTRDGSVIPLLSPKQDFYLQENIKWKLTTAITAVYREQQEVYSSSLTLAKEWAEQFYNMDDPKVQAFITTLDELSQQTIDVDYPNKLKSAELLTDTIRDRLRQQVTPLNAEENPA